MNHSLSSTLVRIQYAGGRSAVKLEQIDESLNSRQLLGRMHMVADAKLPGPRDVPERSALQKALGRGTAMQASTYQAAPAAEISLVRVLGPATRVVTTCDGMNPGDFSIYLQSYGARRWTTVVTYTFKNGTGNRVIHGLYGQSGQLRLDLPRSVVLEMATEDLQRNWTFYCDLFLTKAPSAQMAFPA